MVRKVGIMVMVVMAMFAGHASASLITCYGPCFLACTVESKKPFACAFNCLKQCLSDPDHTNQRFYCTIGCSLSECVEELIIGISLSLYLSLSLPVSLSLSHHLSNLSLSLYLSISLAYVFIVRVYVDLNCRSKSNQN